MITLIKNFLSLLGICLVFDLVVWVVFCLILRQQNPHSWPTMAKIIFIALQVIFLILFF